MKQFSDSPLLVSESNAVRKHHLPPGSDFIAGLRGEDTRLPIYLVGACERHNFGDMLMPHVVQGLLKDGASSSCVGLIDADLRNAGGHRVISCETAFDKLKSAPTVVHFGGATLGCDLASGYAMTATGESHSKITQLIKESPQAALEYARSQTGFEGQTAYVVDAKARWPKARNAFHAVGLSEPEKLDAPREEALLKVLGEAEFAGIRDFNGANFLEKRGIDVTRMPCGVTVLPQVCRKEWSEHSNGLALNTVRNRFPNGWIAVQVSGYRKKVFKPLIRALSGICEKRGLGVVFFAAGTAPGHDDVVELARRVDSFPRKRAMFFPSRNIWDISALIGNSELYVGTSLHGRIVAMAAGVPRINLAVRFAKINSYCRLWEHPSVPYEINVEQLNPHFGNILDMDRDTLKSHAKWLEKTYRSAFSKMCAATRMRETDRIPVEEISHASALERSRQLLAEWTGDSKTLQMLKRISSRRRKKRDVRKQQKQAVLTHLL